MHVKSPCFQVFQSHAAAIGDPAGLAGLPETQEAGAPARLLENLTRSKETDPLK